MERRYTWVQGEAGVGMTPPITHAVRVRADVSKRSVQWMEILTDARGDSDRQFYNFEPGDCEMLDELNWDCEIFASAGHAFVTASMSDGRLSETYWGEPHKFTTAVVLWGLQIWPL